MKTLLIAHRGDTTNFSENTAEAFASAFDKGADGVELDIQWINDEIRVVHDYMHDPKGNYPLLETILDTFGQRGRLEIEIKAFATDILPPLKTLIKNFKPIDLEITTSELPLVSEISQLFPQINIGVNFDKCHYQSWMNEDVYINKTIEQMNLMSAQVAHLSNLPENLITSTFITTLHSAGIKTHYHIGQTTLDKQISLYQKLVVTGVDQCTFDDVNLIDAVRK